MERIYVLSLVVYGRRTTLLVSGSRLRMEVHGPVESEAAYEDLWERARDDGERVGPCVEFAAASVMAWHGMAWIEFFFSFFLE
jgi:hypothetical protein